MHLHVPELGAELGFVGRQAATLRFEGALAPLQTGNEVATLFLKPAAHQSTKWKSFS